MSRYCHKTSIYRWLGVGMIASPAIALALTWFFQLGSEIRSWVFFVEAVGVVVFGSFWITKSTEIALTNSERRALDGKLSTPQLQVADVFRRISVDQVEALER